MDQFFYIERKLSVDGQKYTEDKLLDNSKYIIALAEPGVEKTELLKSLAKKLGTKEVTANVFKNQEC